MGHLDGTGVRADYDTKDLIDEIKIYGKALTVNQVMRLSQRTLPVVSAGVASDPRWFGLAWLDPAPAAHGGVPFLRNNELLPWGALPCLRR